MRFATKPGRTPDGELLIVSSDGAHAVVAGEVAPSLLALVEGWDQGIEKAAALSAALDRGEAKDAFPFDPLETIAPLPRAPQWLDGSAFLNHQRLMAKAFGTPLIPNYDTIPVIYQGASDDFLGSHADSPLPDEADGIDFEGEFGVVVGPVPMGVTADQALSCIRLVAQINDWSLRALGAQEVKTGFGFVRAKPSSSFAPLAVTPDALGSAWRDGRVDLDLHITWNGEWFGSANGMAMHYHFGELIAYAARTRRLSAGTIVGSGTVSNESRRAGSSCIAERRTIEIIEEGRAQTPFMSFGDTVRMEARTRDGATAPFGAIDQCVVQAGAGLQRQ